LSEQRTHAKGKVKAKLEAAYEKYMKWNTWQEATHLKTLC
jgi:hypothetical protein